MLFDAANPSRRKSSMVSDEKTKLAKKMAGAGEKSGQDSACFVHQLLEKQKKSKSHDVLSYVEEEGQSRADKCDDTNDQAKRVHSRLLTKRELSDMAWGVRELSKKLGSVRLRLHVKSVFLLIKAHDPSLIIKARDMVDWLLSKERDTPYIV